MTDLALKTTNLKKIYRGKKMQKVIALQDLNLEVPPGQVFGFLGPNGAGKSTTIKLLTNQIRATAGSAQIFGASVEQTESRHRIGYLPENPSFYDFLSAREYLNFVGRVFSTPTGPLRDGIERVLAVMDLSEAADRPMRTYSKGMVQRLGLAQALIHDPDLYILDEPMSGLDPIGRALVKDVILDMKQRGKTVFFSSHITNDVETICDSFAILNKGRLLVTDSVTSILDESSPSYTILWRTDSGDEGTAEIDSSGLTEHLSQLQSEGKSIVTVSRKQQSMEAFFLEKIEQDNGRAR
jgi:ABC-2 type transport system ATP-binding protein